MFGDHLHAILPRIQDLTGLERISFCQLLAAELNFSLSENSVELLLLHCDLFDFDLFSLIAPLILNYYSKEALLIVVTSGNADLNSEISNIYLFHLLSRGQLMSNLESLFDDSYGEKVKVFNFTGIYHEKIIARLESNEENVCKLLKNLLNFQEYLKGRAVQFEFTPSEILCDHIKALQYSSPLFAELRDKLIGKEGYC